MPQATQSASKSCRNTLGLGSFEVLMKAVPGEARHELVQGRFA